MTGNSMADIFTEQLAAKIFDIALEHNELNHWLTDLRAVSLLSRDTALREKLEDAKTDFSEKIKEIGQRLPRLTPYMVEVITELIRKNRLDAGEDLFIAYQRLMDAHLGIEGAETATVTTAVALDEDFVLDIGKKLTAMTGNPVIIETKVDPAVIGGAIIKIGDKIIDGSIRRRLETLKKELRKTAR